MRRYLATIIGILHCTIGMYGQSISGTITGTVADPSHAVVVGAKVTLIAETTDTQRETITDEAGGFSFNLVQPGSYTLVVESAGFKTFRRANMALTANERLPVEVALEIGAPSETVRVEAQGAAVQTASAERSGLVNASQLSSLQLKGRDFMGLLRLLPGVTDTNARDSPTNNSLTGVSIQGGREGTYNLTLDGVTNLDTGSNTGPYFEPSMDAIAEVKVLLTNYQAEYGRNSGASINVIMKYGGKEFHGSGYYYKRNEALNANSFFNNFSGRPRDRYRYDLYGFTAGGPAYIPGKFNRNRDKLFLFYSEEIAPQRVPNPISFVTMPTALERQGDFSQTRNSDGSRVVIQDAAAHVPYPGNVIPTSQINPNGQAILKIFPLPNVTSPTLQYNYAVQTTLNRPRHVEMLRMDYAINSTTTFYWRGIQSRERFEGTAGIVGYSANWPQIPELYNLQGRGFVANLTKLFSSRTVNEFVFGVNRGAQSRNTLNAESRAANQRSKVGLSTLGKFNPGNNFLDIIPNATFGGVPNAANLALDPKFPFLATNNMWTYTDNLSHALGPHMLKLGIYFTPVARNTRRESIFNGAFDFSRNTNSPLDTGWAWANALTGSFASYTESNSMSFARGRLYNLEWYAQDSWKVHKKLSVELGIRFYLIPPNHTAENNIAAFVPERFNTGNIPLLYQPAIVSGQRVAINPLNGSTASAPLIGALIPGTGDFFNGIVVASQDSSYPRGLMNNRGVQYAPRIGFAYDVFGNGRTAIRSGFGIFYDRIQGDQTYNLVQNPPLRLTPIVYYNNFNTYLQSSGSVFPNIVMGLSRSGELPNVMNWSFGVQHALGFGTVIDVAYVGSAARHLMVQRNINATPYGANFASQNQDQTSPAKPLPSTFFRPYIGYADIQYYEFSSSSNYNALQMQVNRRFARSLQYGVSWTWSKAMDFADGNFSNVANVAPVRVWNYGKAGFDHTHNLVFSFTWDLPKLGQRWNNAVVKGAFDGWQLSGITSFVSGVPLGIGLSTTDGADIPGGGDGARVVVLTNPILPKGERSFTRYFNTDAFGRPAKGTFGNASKDVIRGPGTNNWDLSMLKSFPLKSEARRLQLRGELYNAWNHTQFSSLDTTAQFTPDGKQVNARFGQPIGARPARQMQMSLRFTF